MIKILHQHEINGKLGMTDLYKILYKKCIKELENNNFNMFRELVNIGYYNIKILVDDSDLYEINECVHKIEILLINNITKDTKLLDKMYLLRNVNDEYYYTSINGKIYCNDEHKIIKRGTTHILFDKLIIDNKKLINILKEENRSLFLKFYKNLLNLIIQFVSSINIILTIIITIIFKCFMLFILIIMIIRFMLFLFT